MDARIDFIFSEEMKGDRSFQEKDSPLSRLFGGTTYSKHEMRETWKRGIKHGIEIGLRVASLEGQIVNRQRHLQNEKQQEFLDKFYRLSEEYNCVISYHPHHGSIVVDLNDEWDIKKQ